ncbi:hypothetical protein [Thermoactinospora rubra]|uniref:hypothetical protein n=1 Tax=Thermoactinospora rubra TaxID=1088767 RepID=UPI000A10B32B|nr:hypothetical protein [Thermoactinospora rubra]
MASPRNPRNQIYPPYEPPRGGSGPLTRLWRMRTELLLLAALALVTVAVLTVVDQRSWGSLLALAGMVAVPAATRFGRNWFTARAWCVISRHRIQRTCLETTMHTSTGRIPLVLWITPSRAGEKALILTRAGISAEEFEAYAPELAAACFARAARVYRHRKWSNVLLLEIVRRDETPGVFAPGLERLYGGSWVPVTAASAEEPPDRTRILSSL